MASGHIASSDHHLFTYGESTLRASTATVQQLLKIDGYSWMSKGFGNGKGLRSKSFRVGDSISWHILFYPNGNRDQTSDFVSVFVFLDAACIAVKAVIGFDVLDHTTGEPVVRYSRSDGGQVRNFTCVGAFWGYEDFVRRQEVKKFLLKEDCFSVRCNITVVQFEASACPPDQRSAAPSPPPALPRDLRDLLHSGQGADVTFQVGGVTFAAHRCVLAARSPVFKAQLYGMMKESSAQHSILQIEGMRAEVFRNLLLFAYTDELPPVSEDGGTAAMAQHLLEAADRYGMGRLKLLCEERLCKHIDFSTAVTTLVLAEHHCCSVLKQACFEFLLDSSSTLESVMATEDFDHLTKSCPDLLKEFMFKLAASLHRWRRFGNWRRKKRVTTSPSEQLKVSSYLN